MIFAAYIYVNEEQHSILMDGVSRHHIHSLKPSYNA